MGEQQEKLFAVIGEDARQLAAAEYLIQKGYRVAGSGDLYRADYVLLPMPLTGDNAGFARLLKAAKPGALAFGGKVSGQAMEAAQAAGIQLFDYLRREELALLNAIPTAEGCLELILQNRRKVLWRSPVLVLGYGRCAFALAQRLLALDAKVTVAARRPEALALAMSQGLDTLPLDRLEERLPSFEVVVNTIPALVLDEGRLAALPRGSLVIDLASLPGGTDFEAAERLGLDAIHALSLPARCAPVTAGEFVARAVLTMLEERGESL